jgi:hypothetical protein
MRNSTIKPKIGKCGMCPESRGEQPLTKGLCTVHYWNSRRMVSAEKTSTKEIKRTPGLPDLIDDADAIFSQWVRLSAANRVGLINCFICHKWVRWQGAQAMHFIKRGHLYLRHDPRNVKAGCVECNQFKDGNLIEYAKRLEEESPGIVEILQEEAAIIYKPSREEIRAIISEYSNKLSQLKKAA